MLYHLLFLEPFLYNVLVSLKDTDPFTKLLLPLTLYANMFLLLNVFTYNMILLYCYNY